MGFLSDLADDALDATGKVVRSPHRVICAVTDHQFEWDKETGTYRCRCGATQKKKRPR